MCGCRGYGQAVKALVILAILVAQVVGALMFHDKAQWIIFTGALLFGLVVRGKGFWRPGIALD
jgi:hypothetical protein